ncbi:MAG: response regulator, partial [Bacteroidota bacterium]
LHVCKDLPTPPDVILLDYMMPGMDGDELNKKIKELPDFGSVPVILLSSSSHNPSDPELFNAIYLKPIKHLIIRNKLAALFSGSNEAEQATKKIRQNAIDASFAEKNPLSILVAEDNRVNQKYIQKVFSRLGYEITIVDNGKKVLDQVEENYYDLIFMDLNMPVMDGITSTVKVRANQDIKHQPIIIAMTANAFSDDKERCMEAGMNDYLSKPAKISDITELTEKWSEKIKLEKSRSSD